MAAGRKIRARNDVDQFVDADARIVDDGNAGVDDFAQIMRRHVGGHAHRDAARTIDQEIGKARRKNHRFAFGTVVVLAEIDGVLVDVVEQRMRHLRHAGLGVAHGRRRIAVDRTEIALAIDQRQAERELLRHAHQRVIDRLVAMRDGIYP